MDAPDLAPTPTEILPDSRQLKETPQSIACDLLGQALHILQNHDPRSQTVRAAAGVLVCAVRAIHRQPGEHDEDPGALWAMADTLRALVRAAPLSAEHPARHLAELVDATRRLQDPRRWQASHAQAERAKVVLGMAPDAPLLYRRFTAEGTFQARKTTRDDWTDIPVILSCERTAEATAADERP